MFILLIAWGVAVLRGPQDDGEAVISGQKVDPQAATQVLPALGIGMLLYGVLLIVFLFVSLVALWRISKNYKQLMFRRPLKPTPMTDVWQMHKVPDLPSSELPEGPATGPPPT